MFLKISQNSQENTCKSEACNFIEKETLAQVFFCKSWEIFKNTFLTERFRMTVSYGGPENSLCTSSLYSVHCLYISAPFLNISAPFSNIVVSAHFSEVSVQFSKISTSLISVSVHFWKVSTHFWHIAKPF